MCSFVRTRTTFTTNAKMGLGPSQPTKENYELPSAKHEATLYYFAGRGLADQIRWMLAATNTSFTQKSINTREKMLSMSERQLPFGQLPLLQIDDLEIVQSQAAVRYIAKRGKLLGTTPQEEVKCDMIAETVRDLIPLVAQLPFKRNRGNAEEIEEHMKLLKEKWNYIGARFEYILTTKENKTYLVGDQLTYADVLVAHLITWLTEEAGPDLLRNMPLLVDLQYTVVNIPSVNNFIKSIHYFPLGDEKFCNTVSKVLGRKI